MDRAWKNNGSVNVLSNVQLEIGRDVQLQNKKRLVSSNEGLQQQNQLNNYPNNSNMNSEESKQETKNTRNCIVRTLLPIAVFCMAFAIVMTILLIYLDSVVVQYQQFKQNMSQDYVMNISQFNPELVAYIRGIYMISGKNLPNNQIRGDILPTEKALYIANFFHSKKNGGFIETNAYHLNQISDTEWLEKNLSWHGLLIEPNPTDFVNLQNHGRLHSQIIHAGVMYKEDAVILNTLNNNDPNEVEVVMDKINAEKVEYFNTREKCFPLYTLMLASNLINVDYLNLNVNNSALSILKTLPFNNANYTCNIGMIDVKFDSRYDNLSEIESFLRKNNYIFLKQFNSNYLFSYHSA